MTLTNDPDEEKMMRWKLIFSLALIFTLPALANRLAAQDKVRVAISNFSASYIPMVLANNRGYYAEEGMTLEIILMAGLTSTRALIGNSVEFGSASATMRRISLCSCLMLPGQS